MASFSFTPENRPSLLLKGAYALSIILTLVAGRTCSVRARTVIRHKLGSGERERRQPGYRGRDTWSGFRGQSQGQHQREGQAHTHTHTHRITRARAHTAARTYRGTRTHTRRGAPSTCASSSALGSTKLTRPSRSASRASTLRHMPRREQVRERGEGRKGVEGGGSYESGSSSRPPVQSSTLQPLTRAPLGVAPWHGRCRPCAPAAPSGRGGSRCRAARAAPRMSRPQPRSGCQPPAPD